MVNHVLVSPQNAPVPAKFDISTIFAKVTITFLVVVHRLGCILWFGPFLTTVAMCDFIIVKQADFFTQPSFSNLLS